MRKGIEKGFYNLADYNIKKALIILIISTAGSILQIGGGSWDVTSHLLQKPETFFTPSHALLYSGVGLLVTSAVISLSFLYRFKENKNTSIKTPFRLIIIGSAMSLVAGPADFLWHQTFGIDGLLSPTHITLMTGMLINSVAVVLGLTRITSILQKKGLSNTNWIKAFMIPSYCALWLTISWYTYAFALPFSNGQHFNFNLDSSAETLIATTILPLFGSIIFITASKTIGWYGGSLVFALVIGITALTNIIPSEKLLSTLPWYLALVPIGIVANLIVNKNQRKRSQVFGASLTIMVTGAMIGSMFYFIGYPMLPNAFSEFLGYYGMKPINDLQTMVIDSMHVMLPFTIITGAIMGVIGSFVSIKILNYRKESDKKFNNAESLV
jgi:hypothetical protein